MISTATKTLATEPRDSSRRETFIRAVGVFLAVALIWGLVLVNFPAGEKKSALDFSQFYCAAQIVRDGEGHQLYDLRLQAECQSKVAAVHVFFNHPPFEALWYLPFTLFSYRSGYLIWTGLSIGLLSLAVRHIGSCTAVVRAVSDYARIEADHGLVFVLFLTFAPVTTCLLLGQDSMLTLVIYTLVFISLKRGADFRAGCILALGLYKFQLIVPFVLILLLRKKWSAVRGFACVGLPLVLISVLVSGLGVLLAYPRMLLFDPAYQKVAGFAPDFMPNLRGLVSLVTEGRLPTTVSAVLLATLSGVCIWWAAKTWRDDHFGTSFSASLLATVLVSYHLYDYDLALLLLPVAILCGELASHRRLLQAHSFNLVLVVLFVAPLHRFLLIHDLYPLMAIPVITMFVLSSRLSEVNA